jgi:hypothetical protein
MIDIATGLSIDPPIAWSTRAAIRNSSVGATAQQRSQREQHQPGLEHLAPADPVRGRSRQHQQAGDRERVGVDRPLKPRHGRVQRAMDRRQRDVHDRHVEPDDQQAHRADDQHQKPAPAAEPGPVAVVSWIIHVDSILPRRLACPADPDGA